MMISQGAGGKLETGISCNLPASSHPFLSFVLHFGIVYFPLPETADFWQNRAVAARKAHNLEVAGSSPASATTGIMPDTWIVR